MPYTISGQSAAIFEEPRQENGTHYLPLREVMEALGGSASWENSTKTAGATLNGRHARLPVGESWCTVDGQHTILAQVTQMDGNQIWVPIDFFQAAFGIPARIDGSGTVTL